MAQHDSFLLVDDDVDDVLLFEEVLREVDKDIRLFSSSNGMEALEFLQKNSNNLPRLIFLDLNMPRMDGKECLKAIKQDARFNQVPVIMYTTSSQSRDIEETMMMGAVCFITKPSSVKDLRSIIATISSTPAQELTKTLRRLSNTSAYIIC
jgi:CheY-like chemotaxis protein